MPHATICCGVHLMAAGTEARTLEERAATIMLGLHHPLDRPALDICEPPDCAWQLRHGLLLALGLLAAPNEAGAVGRMQHLVVVAGHHGGWIKFSANSLETGGG